MFAGENYMYQAALVEQWIACMSGHQPSQRRTPPPILTMHPDHLATIASYLDDPKDK